jgi:hypothetical protein
MKIASRKRENMKKKEERQKEENETKKIEIHGI